MANFVQYANVFLSRDRGSAIVARTRNHGGLIVEVPDGPVRLELGDDPAELGDATLTALRSCEAGGAVNLRDAKKTDWPAFRASGCRSVAAFERTYVAYSVCGANASNIIYVATSQPFGPDVSLTSSRSSGASADDAGAWLRELHDVFLRVESIATP